MTTCLGAPEAKTLCVRLTLHHKKGGFWNWRSIRWIGETGLTMAGLTIIRERLKKMRESSLGAIETDVCGT